MAQYCPAKSRKGQGPGSRIGEDMGKARCGTPQGFVQGTDEKLDEVA